MTEITEEKFVAYESIRKSGRTNMMNVPRVVKLSGQMTDVQLEKAEVSEIIKNYSEYSEEFGDQDE
jgi:hypothetical protein